MRRLLAAAVAALSLLLVGVAPASAAFGLTELDVTFTNLDNEVSSTASQAGSHPFAFTTTLGVNTKIVPESYENPETHVLEDGEVPEGEVKDLLVSVVPGLVGNPTAVPRCTSAEFNTRIEGRPQCPDSAAVGIVAVKAEFNVYKAGLNEYVHVPVYNLIPGPGEPARFGFVALNVPIVIDTAVNPDPPYNIVARVADISQAVLFYGSRLTLWGNPASSAHDELRGDCVGEPVESTPAPVSLGSCHVEIPKEPFLTLPRACEGPLQTGFTVDPWGSIGDFTAPLYATTHDDLVPPNPQGMTGCETLKFDPTTSTALSTTAAESPAGLDFTVEVKDAGLTAPDGTAKSDIEKIEVTLPEGVTANPSAAEGLAVCTPGQYDAAGLAASGCPEASKLGSLEVETPILENHTLHGSVYLAQSDDAASPGHENPFDSLLALYLVVRDPELGVFAKMPAKVEPNPATGQLVTTVDEIPQFPFSRIRTHLRGGPRAPLTTPALCGTYATHAILTPWAGGDPVDSTSTFKVSSGPGGGPCPAGAPFHPVLEAGSTSNAAGRYSPFFMRLLRQDGEQDMTRFDAVLPSGVVPKLAGLTQCPDAAIAAAAAKTGRQEQAAPSCPPSSEIGHVLAGAGVGSALTYVPGRIYLAGPFGGHPLSAAVIVPAVAGPFDVGTVVTREALDLNPVTYLGEIDGAASDPIPHILEGIPLKLRDLRVYVDRPEFMRNPTSCAEEHTVATLFGAGANLFSAADDVPALATQRYQASSCASLRFKPKLTLRLKGGTKRNDHPALHSVLVPRTGDANIRKAVVTLPPSEFIDNAHINNPCTRVQFNAGACPRGSILGRARATTPLLDEPLEGPVYFRSNGGERLLPDIVADLHGQFHVTLVGFVDSKNGRIRTTFATAPDAPVTRFVLDLNGGRKGLLVNSADLCARKRHVRLVLDGQNGKRYRSNPVLRTDCKRKHAARFPRARR